MRIIGMDIASSLRMSANELLDRGDAEGAIRLLAKAIGIRHKGGDRLELALLYNNLGVT